MLGSVLKKVFGTKVAREVKRLTPLVDKINSLEPQFEALSDTDLFALTSKFKVRLDSGETLDDILPEAFAAVREASKRKLGMRHFDVQLIGGITLHEGKIAEMRTGEGKTLAATLPVYLNAISGLGVHVVTVNDYLAKRDAQWMAPVYHALGMSLGVIQHEVSLIADPSLPDTPVGETPPMISCSRSESYRAHITYGTNNEYGFDYLRDNMKFSMDEYSQRELNFAIVDEVDSILVDEARTPLIISGPAEASTDKYYTIDGIIPFLKVEKHYTIDEKAKQAHLTDDGVSKVEELLKIENLYDPRNIETLHHVGQGLRAHVLFSKDVDYVVKDGAVVIVDEFTGRLMDGRRWSDGLHQAVEAKEKVKIENENQTLATITFQNYFRMYDKLAGMTGTAETEAPEFMSIYKLDVLVVPTHKPMIRDDRVDLVYKTKREKFLAVIEDVKKCAASGRPVLVGTISIEDSEQLSVMLKKQGVKHNVLNAKQHEREAEIVAQAGRLGAITLSTNMAGRGTDIVLGGNPGFMAAAMVGGETSGDKYDAAFAEVQRSCEEEKQKVLKLGGLYIIGTERHESRRIDNQLRGRSGRQGDPGESRFYMSLEDDLMRIFGSDRVASIMSKLGMEEGIPIEHSIISRAVENSQKKVEAHNFDMRKHLIEYDDVMNQQRNIVYEYRRQILGEVGLRDMVQEFVNEAAEVLVATHVDEKKGVDDEEANVLIEAIDKQFGIEGIGKDDVTGGASRQAVTEMLITRAWDAYLRKVAEVGPELMPQVERIMSLHTLDNLWKDHLLTMDHLKGGIGLRGYAQQNPLNEYKREGFELFAGMITAFKCDVVERLFKVQVKEGDDEALEEADAERPTDERNMVLGRGEEGGGVAGGPTLEDQSDFYAEGGADGDHDHSEGGEVVHTHTPILRGAPKIGRNEPCPCGSGKKYKKCCGASE
ncbi:Protein translocase subunit SecA [hydrothermal vent metagenome]|uniref:Protein translocase subunit SecA n=1 Tax=hydrothermal vent metagenome TaxID=652676 RepID=A0A3B0QUC5_9ZZZZ